MTTIIRTTGILAIQKTLERLDGRDRQNTLRRAVRAATKPFAAELGIVAASSNVPRSFQKIPAAKISTQRGASGREIGATVRPKSPLFNIFEPGARPHEIAPRSKFLSGPKGSGSWDPAGRKRGDAFFSRNAVRHPGMAARDILGPAFAAAEPAAMSAFDSAVFGTAESTAG